MTLSDYSGPRSRLRPYLRSLLEGLCKEITLRYGGDASTVSAEYRNLVVELPNWLAMATAEKPLVLFLDALDQLSDTDHGRNLAWLPMQLPEHVRVVVSTLSGECLTTLEQKRLGQTYGLPQFLEMTPMNANDGEELLTAWLSEARRTLQADERREVLEKFVATGLPLYLKLAFEEARLWRTQGVEASQPVSLSLDIPSVLRDLFARLEQPQHHGSLLVSRALGYLSVARHGLTEDELLDVLSVKITLRGWHCQNDRQRRSSRKNLEFANRIF